jgi:hypothetical protein
MHKANQARALLICIAMSALWPTPLLGEDVTVTVRLVNGKNGKPITDENLNVWVNDATGSQLFRPDRDGIIKLRVGSNDVLSFASNIQVTCHTYSRDEHSIRKYRVSEILALGISDENLCSKKVRVEAKPGEFVFYERPRTFLEWWRL